MIRANAGLYYTSYEEFAEALRLLETNRVLRERFGANGRAYFRRHYTWPVIEQKYLDMFERLQEEDRRGVPDRLEPMPGWWARHRRTVPPAGQIVDQLPTGPVRAERGHA